MQRFFDRFHDLCGFMPPHPVRNLHGNRRNVFQAIAFRLLRRPLNGAFERLRSAQTTADTIA